MTVVGAEVLQEGFSAALWMVAPAAGAAVLAALLVGWLAHKFGVHDAVPVLAARATAVVAVLWWSGAGWFAAGAAWTRALWAALPAIGRG